AVQRAMERYVRRQVTAVERAARRLPGVLPGRAVVLTLSSSEVVYRALLAARRRGRLARVVVAESRPGREGEALARRLAARGVPGRRVAGGPSRPGAGDPPFPLLHLGLILNAACATPLAASGASVGPGRKPMRRMYVLAIAVLASACTATVDKQSVKATQTAPESTQVEVVRLPYDPSLPYYVVTVEPLSFDAGGEGGGSAPPVPGRRYGWGPWGW